MTVCVDGALYCNCALCSSLCVPSALCGVSTAVLCKHQCLELALLQRIAHLAQDARLAQALDDSELKQARK